VILLFFIPFGLGVLGVIQTVLNRHIASHHNFKEAIWVNGFFVFASASAYLLTQFLFRDNSQQNGSLSILKDFKFYYCLPGILGFLLVLGFPWSTAQFGAVRVFVAAVTGQLLMSLAYDWINEGARPDWSRITGVGLALLGALVANIKALRA
jgi:uncharacterized membrane protein YdcZ (DUF606 family)